MVLAKYILLPLKLRRKAWKRIIAHFCVNWRQKYCRKRENFGSGDLPTRNLSLGLSESLFVQFGCVDLRGGFSRRRWVSKESGRGSLVQLDVRGV
jgi:hypothetical protein